MKETYLFYVLLSCLRFNIICCKNIYNYNIYLNLETNFNQLSLENVIMDKSFGTFILTKNNNSDIIINNFYLANNNICYYTDNENNQTSVYKSFIITHNEYYKNNSFYESYFIDDQLNFYLETKKKDEIVISKSDFLDVTCTYSSLYIISTIKINNFSILSEQNFDYCFKFRIFYTKDNDSIIYYKTNYNISDEKTESFSEYYLKEFSIENEINDFYIKNNIDIIYSNVLKIMKLNYSCENIVIFLETIINNNTSIDFFQINFDYDYEKLFIKNYYSLRSSENNVDLSILKINLIKIEEKKVLLENNNLFNENFLRKFDLLYYNNFENNNTDTNTNTTTINTTITNTLTKNLEQIFINNCYETIKTENQTLIIEIKNLNKNNKCKYNTEYINYLDLIYYYNDSNNNKITVIFDEQFFNNNEIEDGTRIDLFKYGLIEGEISNEIFTINHDEEECKEITYQLEDNKNESTISIVFFVRDDTCNINRSIKEKIFLYFFLLKN